MPATIHAKTRRKQKTWTKTKRQYLWRHKSGRYYARAYANGKEVWESLNTFHFGVAESKLADFLQTHLVRRSNGDKSANPAITFGEALRIHERALEDDPGIKPTTVHYWTQIFRALLRSWPDLQQSELRRITRAQCEDWAIRFRKTASPTRWNNTLAGLRHVFDVGIAKGVIYQNPAARPLAKHSHSPLQRVKVRPKDVRLPKRSDFSALVQKIAHAGGRFSRQCSELVQGLAFTGMRKSEAAALQWRDVMFDREEIVVRGDPVTGTKNWEVRRVPMTPEAHELFSRMRSIRGHEESRARVFRVHESQKAIDSACRKLGIARITHHDLRHIFTTTCVESGVDIPTVAEWLGHKDKGRLASNIYNHLRREHSAQQAKKVHFLV
jgi:integrase